MKKIVVLIAFISITYFAKAQTSQGNMMLGGSFGLSSTSYQSSSNASSSSFTVAPSFGYFVKDNFVVGALVSLSTSKDQGFGETKRNSFGVGPFVRFYKFTSNEQFAFFGNASLAFGGSKVESTNTGIDKTSSISFAVSPGFAYFFNEHWAAELAIAGLRVQNSKDPDTNNSGITTVSFDISSFSPNLGIRYHFGN